MEKKELLDQVVNCGNLIEKKREHFKKIDVDDSVLLNGLNDDEQETLSTLLSKMKQYWIEAHKAKHSKN